MLACFKNQELFGDVKFAVWYIRIRDKSKTRTAFDGIVKVEKMLITHEENEYGIDSELREPSECFRKLRFRRKTDG